MRTADSDTYDAGNGQYEVKTYTGPINYQVNGAWTPIDDTLVAASGGGWTNTAGPFQAQLPADASGAMTITSGSDSASLAMTGASGAGKPSGDQVTYAGALPGASLTYRVSNIGVDQSLVLTGPTASNVESFKLTLGKGLTVADAPAGNGLRVMDGNKLAFSIPAPDTTDAAGSDGLTTIKATPAVSGISTVTVAVDTSWLSGARFPVTVDPSITPGEVTDCHIVSPPRDATNYCGQEIEIGFSSAFGVRRGMFKFDLSSIPQTDKVLGADLHVVRDTTYTSTSNTLDATELDQAWDSTVTWADATTGTAWTGGAGGTCLKPSSAGGGSGSCATGTAKVFASLTDGGTGTADYDLTRMAQDWVVAPGNNDGVMLKAHNEATAAVLRYYYMGSPSGDQPSMTVWYTAPGGSHGSDTTFDRTLNDRTSLHANLVTGNVLVQSNDLNITGVGINYNITRTYNSRGVGATAFGPGWSGGALDERLDFKTYADSVVHAVAFTDPSGYQSSFTKVNTPANVTDCTSGPDGSSWCPPPGVDATLSGSSFTSGATWTLTYHQSGEKLTFTVSSSGTFALLTADSDRNGNQLTYTNHYPGGVLTSTTIASSWDPTNSVTVNYNTSGASAGFVSSISDWASTPRTWQYTYTSGVLTGYTDPNSKTYTYLYDGSGNLKEVDTPGTATLITYSGSNVASVQQILTTGPPAGPTTNINITSAAGDGTGTTTLTDPLSHATTYNWSASGKVSKVTDADGNTHTPSWTPDDQLSQISSTPSGGGTASDSGIFGWDQGIGNGNLDNYTSASGASTKYDYTGSGATEYQPSEVEGASGSNSYYGYDPNGNLQTSKSSSSASAPSYTVNHQNSARTTCTNAFAGQVCSITDNKSNSTSFTYDSTGKLTGITYPSPLGAWTISQDTYYRNSAVTDGNGQKRTYIYDPLDRITKLELNGATGCTPSAGTCVQYGYDADGNEQSITDANGATTLAYDALNRLKSQTQGIDGSSAAYTYNDDNTLFKVLDTAFGDTYYAKYYYDNARNLTSVDDNGGGTITIGLSSDGHENRSTITYPTTPATTVNLNPDKGGQPQEIKVSNTGGTLFDSSYCYFYNTSTNVPACASGTNIKNTGVLEKQVDNTTSTTTNYDYTPAPTTSTGAPPGMLCMAYTGTYTTACSGTGLTNLYKYAYDANGNMTSAATPSTTTNFLYNAADELCGSSSGTPSCSTGTTYSYDSDGNLTSSSSGSYSIGFFPNNDIQTKTATTPTGSLNSMAYIGADQNQRVTAGPHNYLNGASLGGVPTIDADQDTTGGVTKTMFFTRTPDGVLLAEHVYGTSGPGDYYYTLDNIGSVRQLINSSGAVAATYTYDPYGNTTSTAPPGTIHNPWGYAGGYTDTKNGLIKFGARYYNPALYRWTQQDPMTGSAGNPLTTNRYIYASNDPQNQTDPAGTTSEGLLIAGGVLLGASLGIGAIGVFGFGGVGLLLAEAGAPGALEGVDAASAYLVIGSGVGSLLSAGLFTLGGLL